MNTFIYDCQKQNISSLSTDYINAAFNTSHTIISLLFKDKANVPAAFVSRFQELLWVLNDFSEKNKQPQISSEVRYFIGFLLLKVLYRDGLKHPEPVLYANHLNSCWCVNQINAPLT